MHESLKRKKLGLLLGVAELVEGTPLVEMVVLHILLLIGLVCFLDKVLDSVVVVLLRLLLELYEMTDFLRSCWARRRPSRTGSAASCDLRSCCSQCWK